MLKEGLLDKNKFRQENRFSDYVFPFYGADTMLNTREKAEGKKHVLKSLESDFLFLLLDGDIKERKGTVYQTKRNSMFKGPEVSKTSSCKTRRDHPVCNLVNQGRLSYTD